MIGQASRSRLERRLRKLEGRLTEGSGLVPHSPGWMEYWMREINTTLAERDPGPKRIIPIEALRAWMHAQPKAPMKTKIKAAAVEPTAPS